MRFRAGDLAFTASVTEVHEEPSPQTGAPLKWLTIQFRAQTEELHEQALAAANDGSRGGLFSVSETGDEADIEWRVVDSSVQFVGNPPWGVNHHTWVVQQVERVACSLLRVGDVELEPYDYAEELSPDGTLRLAARAPISVSDLASITALKLSQEPIDVTRVGISNEPRRMRVDDYAWGQGARGQGVVVRLVDITERHIHVGAPDQQEAGLVDDVLTLLRSNGMLSSAALDGLQARRHAARRVRDLDAWDL
jgi:hypothetical protein